jgi:hypothetical protein
MESNIPYGTQWIKDLVPGASWDAPTSTIKMPDGSTLDKSAYTIVNSKAYVAPSSVSKYITPAAPKPVATPTAPAVTTPPAGSMWLRDLVPNAAWDNTNRSITLPTGDVLPSNMYSLIGGKAYVNPASIASYYAPKPITAETTQPWIDQATAMYKPMMDTQYARIDNLIAVLQDKLKSNIQGLNAQGDISRSNLQNQEQKDSETLRNQAIARGTYTSGVADHQQQEMAGDYAGQYSNLEGTIASAIAAANSDANGQISDLGYQATTMQDSFTEKIMNMVNSLMNTSNATNQTLYSNIMDKGAAQANGQNDALTSAMARTEMFGKVVTAADAAILGVPVGTPSQSAKQAAASLSASGGGGGGTGGGIGGLPTIDLTALSTDQKRAFDAGMQTWEVTGSSPASLAAFGIPQNTGFNAEFAAQIAEDKKINTLMTALTPIAQGAGSADIEAAATALARANNNPTAAVNYINSVRDAYIAAGVNINVAISLINKSQAVLGGRSATTTTVKPVVTPPKANDLMNSYYLNQQK